MIATIVHVWVKENHIDDFIRVSAENHRNSVLEPGNLRFDFLQDANDPSKFTFYEAYMSEDDVAAHKQTSHYLQWKEKVADWMAKPRQGIKHQILYPEERPA
jgi:autoinducer 2-degrading protein